MGLPTRHELLKVAPGADRALLRWITDLLASDVESDALARLATTWWRSPVYWPRKRLAGCRKRP
jgi:hypothetical protein